MKTPDLTASFKSSVIVPALLAPVFGGAIIYYSLRETQPELARTANRMSFIGFAVWLALYYFLQQPISGVGFTVARWIGPVTFVFGVAHAVVVVRRIKKAMAAAKLPPSVAREK